MHARNVKLPRNKIFVILIFEKTFWELSMNKYFSICSNLLKSSQRMIIVGVNISVYPMVYMLSLTKLVYRKSVKGVFIR